MNAQEQQMLQGLIDRVRNTHPADKDPDAEQLLQSSLGSDPDALYVLAQTLLVQQYALSQAQRQLAQLRAENDQLRQQGTAPPKHTSFLSSLFGHDEPQRPAAPPPPTPLPASSGAGYSPLPNYPGVAPGSVQYPPPQYAQPGYAAPSAGGGFLRSALQTATGVAAGALAFQGIEDLMHGFGHAGGYGSGFMPMAEAAPREEVVNNYYGDAGPNTGSEHSGSFLPDLNQGTGAGQNTSGNDIWNTSTNTLAGASGDTSSGDQGRDVWTSGGDATGNALAGTADETSFQDASATDNSGSYTDDAGTDDTGDLGDDPGSDDPGSDDSGSDDSGSFGEDGGGFDDSGSFGDSGDGGF